MSKRRRSSSDESCSGESRSDESSSDESCSDESRSDESRSDESRSDESSSDGSSSDGSVCYLWSAEPAEITQELYQDTIFNFCLWEPPEKERISNALVEKLKKSKVKELKDLGQDATLTDELGIGSSGRVYKMKNGNVVKIVLESYLHHISYDTFYFQTDEDDFDFAEEMGEKNLGPKIFEHGYLYLEYEKGEEKKLNKKNSEYLKRTGELYDHRDPILHKEGIKVWYMVMEELYNTDVATNNDKYRERREKIEREIRAMNERAGDFEFGFIKPGCNISDLRAFDVLLDDRYISDSKLSPVGGEGEFLPILRF